MTEKQENTPAGKGEKSKAKTLWDFINPPERVRGVFYRAVFASSPILVFYGFLTENEAAMWLGAFTLVFGGYTSGNTSIRSSKGRDA